MRLPVASYLAFPFRVAAQGARASSRREHVRDVIAQVLLTIPGERVHRPEFGGGVQRLVFEPGTPALWEITKKRLVASLTDALKGDVDPRTLEVEIAPATVDEDPTVGALEVRIAYRLAAVNEREEQTYTVGVGEAGHG